MIKWRSLWGCPETSALPSASERGRASSVESNIGRLRRSLGTCAVFPLPTKPSGSAQPGLRWWLQPFRHENLHGKKSALSITVHSPSTQKSRTRKFFSSFLDSRVPEATVLSYTASFIFQAHHRWWKSDPSRLGGLAEQYPRFVPDLLPNNRVRQHCGKR